MNSGLQRIASDRNLWMAAIFVCYVALIFVFAAVYYLLFKNNRHVFAFNADILRAQSVSAREASYGELKQLEVELSNLRQLQAELSIVHTGPIKREGIRRPFPHRDDRRSQGALERRMAEGSGHVPGPQ